MKIKEALLALTRTFSKGRLHDTDLKQEALVKQGREQFKKLLDKGLGVPVVFL